MAKQKLTFPEKLRRISDAIAPSIVRERGRRQAFSPLHFKKEKTIKQLQQAIERGDAEIVQNIVANLDIKELEEGNKSYVTRACEIGNFKIINLLLDHDANVNIIGQGNCAPLHIAAKSGDMTLMHLLLKHGANVHIFTKYERKCALHIAVFKEHFDMVRLLIENETNVNLGDIYGRRPLHIACSKGSTDIVNLLLSSKADVNFYDNEGWTSLHHAANADKIQIVRTLVDHHANLDSQNKYGRTALHLACLGSHLNVVHVLVQNGADPTIKDVHGKLANCYCSNESAKAIIMKPKKTSLPQSAVSSDEMCTSLYSEMALSEYNISENDSVTDEESTLNTCFESLVAVSNTYITNMSESVNQLTALFDLTNQGSIDLNNELLKDYRKKLAEIKMNVKSMKSDFRNNYEAVASLIGDCKSDSDFFETGHPLYISLLQMLVQCINIHIGQENNGWKTFLSGMPLTDEGKKLLTLQLSHSSMPDCDKVNKIIMYWARTCNEERVPYMRNLLLAVEKCEVMESETEHVDSIIEELINMELNYRSGNAKNTETKIAWLIQQLDDKQVRRMYHEIDSATENINIFPSLENLSSPEVSDVKRTSKGSVKFCDQKLEEMLIETIEEEDTKQMVAAVKSLIMSEHEHLLTCIL